MWVHRQFAGGDPRHLDADETAVEVPGSVRRIDPVPESVRRSLANLRYEVLLGKAGDPVTLVHAATAPRAANLVLPALPEQMWAPTYEAAWALTAAISIIYWPSTPPPPTSRSEQHTITPEQVTLRAVATDDPRAIKYVEVAQESHHRGNSHALAAGARASCLIAPVDVDR